MCFCKRILITLPFFFGLKFKFFYRIIRILHLDREFWRRYFDVYNLDFSCTKLSWDENVNKIKEHRIFFENVRYKFDPCDSNGFDEEYSRFITPNIAVANYFYSVVGDVERYQEIFDEIRNALDFYRKSDEKVELTNGWIDSLHGQATISCIQKNASKGAELNLKCSHLFSKLGGHDIDVITYCNCSICSRIESISYYEEYLFDSIEDKLNKNIRELEDKLSRESNDVSQKIGVYTSLYYAYILKCKNQVSRNNPNVGVLRKSIEKAKEFWGELKEGDTKESGRFIILIYEAFLYKLEDGQDEKNRNIVIEKYTKALKLIKEKNIYYYCLIRLPESVNNSMSAYTGLEVVQNNSGFIKLKKNKNNNALSVSSIWFRTYFSLNIALFFAFFLFLKPSSIIINEFVSENNINKYWGVSAKLLIIFLFVFVMILLYKFFSARIENNFLRNRYSLEKNTTAKIKFHKGNVWNIFLGVLLTGLVTFIPMLLL